MSHTNGCEEFSWFEVAHEELPKLLAALTDIGHDPSFIISADQTEDAEMVYSVCISSSVLDKHLREILLESFLL